MNEIIEALQKLQENCPDVCGRDGNSILFRIAGIIKLAEGDDSTKGETNSQRVRRLIAAGNYSI